MVYTQYPRLHGHVGNRTQPQLQLPKVECPNHGNCMACVENHKANSNLIPFCLRFMVENNQA
mgnify:CR=1 FL=1